MAIYFLNIKTFGRSDGSSAPGAAAYRAGERIRDERTGRVYDHSARQDVLHKEIILPASFADSDMAWAKDRASLWNAAELAETRKNARVAREYLVALPVELSHEQRVGLVRGFSQELADRYRFAVDVAIHAPRDFPGSDPRNFHAHLLATTRQVTTESLGAKTTLELADSSRRQLGLGPAIEELQFARQHWAHSTNEALRAAEATVRIDHRAPASGREDPEPRLWIPRVPYEMERRGYRSEVAERLRDEHRELLAARAREAANQGVERSSPDIRGAPASLGAGAGSNAEGGVGTGAGANSAVAGAGRKPLSLDEIRREARESWLRMRREATEQRETPDATRSRDEDLSR